MLKRVSIQNFKSLKDVTLDLQKVNLLIGPNNSGKTNFLKALSYVSTITSEIGSNAISSVSDKKQESPDLSFGFINKGKEHYYYYWISYSQEPEVKTGFIEFMGISDQLFELSSRDLSDIDSLSEIFKEYDLSVNDDSPRGYIWYKKYSEENPFKVADCYNFYLKKTDNSYSRNKSLPSGFIFREYWKAVNAAKYFIFNDERNPFDNLLIYRPDPNTLKQPKPLAADKILNEDCSNLVPFLFNLGQNQKRVLKDIEYSLGISTGDIVGVSTPTVETNEGNMLKLKFFDTSDVAYWVDDVSEGVLYFLSLLCIINQPNPPKLLLLEEPEKGIHPRRIREVMDFIFRLAEEKDVQIILTSHNEHVLDDFATRPEAVFVFDKDEEGATYVRNLQTDIIEPTNKHNQELGLDEIDLTTNLSENWLYGLLGGVPSIP